ncbi:hypothetical protein [Campylobacter devanensis]|nr:hypothetical protein [Campylobacter sp. P162]
MVFLLLGGGIGSLWVAFRYYGGIWQRNLTAEFGNGKKFAGVSG